MTEWYAEDCMDTPSKLHMRDYYVLKDQGYDHDTSTYMEALSGRNIAHVGRSEG